MKKSFTITVCVLFAFLAFVVLGKPESAAAAVDSSKKTIKIAYVEWPCAVATTHIVKTAIEDRLGYPCEILPVSVAVKFQALATGQADATVCAWLPNTQKSYWEKVKEKGVEDLGPLVGGAKLGWVVPDYVPYTSIEELKGKSKEFGGKIYGIDPGAEYMDNSRKAIKDYGLDGFELVDGSDAIMVAMLADSVRKKRPVIVTGWAPHWKFGRWDLHFLDDPKKLFGEEERIHTLVRAGLKEEMPDLYAFLDKFHFTGPKQLQGLMAENVEKGANPAKNARKFVDENKDLVDSWFK